MKKYTGLLANELLSKSFYAANDLFLPEMPLDVFTLGNTVESTVFVLTDWVDVEVYTLIICVVHNT